MNNRAEALSLRIAWNGASAYGCRTRIGSNALHLECLETMPKWRGPEAGVATHKRLFMNRPITFVLVGMALAFALMGGLLGIAVTAAASNGVRLVPNSDIVIDLREVQIAGNASAPKSAAASPVPPTNAVAPAEAVSTVATDPVHPSATLLEGEQGIENEQTSDDDDDDDADAYLKERDESYKDTLRNVYDAVLGTPTQAPTPRIVRRPRTPRATVAAPIATAVADPAQPIATLAPLNPTLVDGPSATATRPPAAQPAQPAQPQPTQSSAAPAPVPTAQVPLANPTALPPAPPPAATQPPAATAKPREDDHRTPEVHPTERPEPTEDHDDEEDDDHEDKESATPEPKTP